MIFVHLTKTAGTTLATVLEQQDVDQRICRTDHDFDRFEDHLAWMPETTKRSIDCLSGHRAFGLHRSKNVTPNRPPRSRLSPGARRLIEQYNRLDMELYEHAAGLFEQQLRRHGITPVRVAAFRMAARFRRARRALGKRVWREATRARTMMGRAASTATDDPGGQHVA